MQAHQLPAEIVARLPAHLRDPETARLFTTTCSDEQEDESTKILVLLGSSPSSSTTHPATFADPRNLSEPYFEEDRESWEAILQDFTREKEAAPPTTPAPPVLIVLDDDREEQDQEHKEEEEEEDGSHRNRKRRRIFLSEDDGSSLDFPLDAMTTFPTPHAEKEYHFFNPRRVIKPEPEAEPGAEPEIEVEDPGSTAFSPLPPPSPLPDYFATTPAGGKGKRRRAEEQGPSFFVLCDKKFPWPAVEMKKRVHPIPKERRKIFTRDEPLTLTMPGDGFAPDDWSLLQRFMMNRPRMHSLERSTHKSILEQEWITQLLPNFACLTTTGPVDASFTSATLEKVDAFLPDLGDLSQSRLQQMGDLRSVVHDPAIALCLGPELRHVAFAGLNTAWFLISLMHLKTAGSFEVRCHPTLLPIAEELPYYLPHNTLVTHAKDKRTSKFPPVSPGSLRIGLAVLEIHPLTVEHYWPLRLPVVMDLASHRTLVALPSIDLNTFQPFSASQLEAARGQGYVTPSLEETASLIANHPSVDLTFNKQIEFENRFREAFKSLGYRN